MASLGQRFDATSYDTEQRDFEDLPLGIYKFEISASEVAATNDGNGTILKTVLDVVEPEALKGRKLFNNNYNLENASSKAQEIGQRQFASLCRAIGVDGVEDSEELHFRPFTAKLGMGKPSKGRDGKDYPARPEIKVYYFPDSGPVPEPSIDANQPVPAPKAANDNKPAARQPAQQTAAASGQRRPWGSK